jgi:hypothetical protein
LQSEHPRRLRPASISALIGFDPLGRHRPSGRKPIIDPCGQQPSSALPAGIDLSVGAY